MRNQRPPEFLAPCELTSVLGTFAASDELPDPDANVVIWLQRPPRFKSSDVSAREKAKSLSIRVGVRPDAGESETQDFGTPNDGLNKWPVVAGDDRKRPSAPTTGETRGDLLSISATPCDGPTRQEIADPYRTRQKTTLIPEFPRSDF